MRMILLGPPGAGKGTQAVELTAKYDMVHISTGDIFRAAIRDKTELGQQAQEYMDRGELVPDSVVIGMVGDRLQQNDVEKGWLLDGFPRTIEQANGLSKILDDGKQSLDAVVLIEVPDEVLVSRLTARRVCRNCGATYHLEFKPPQKENVCDLCGGEVYQRVDDQEATIRNRLAVYHQQTSPLIEYYQQQGVLCRVDGNQPIPQVMSQISEKLGR